jgi:hypothetical protein
MWYENDGRRPTGWTPRAVPAVENGFYDLVRGTNDCGAGSYGASSAAAERISTACP